ncbi:resuscitation-promoting factor [Promicromonospora sp. MEB111]|uniref:resuscitation-promoting factor n=1 Tax=Promicromonospora sp. MEB111 TaxID=3040301 RepID=UPI00254D8F6B|nr:resuscitation-promoting factor [Promicromonospora sp. MEB111]
MSSPHPAQGIPSEQPPTPEAGSDVGITEIFEPPSTVHPLVPPDSPQPAPPRKRHRRAALLAGAAAIAVAGAGGITAYGSAHKTVTLDVDGKVTTVETFQGDVAGLLADEGVDVTDRDAVTPGGSLRDGSMVVVRYGHEITLQADGERRTTWVTALDADEALATLSERADDVALVPSRSGGRVTLPLRLDADSPVNLVVGGKTERVADGAAQLDELLAEHDVTVDSDDRVTVERSDGASDRSADPSVPTLSVVVEQVRSSVKKTVTRLPYDKVRTADPDRYEDLDPYVATKGVVGKRVTTWDVTTVDGEVVKRDKRSSKVERKPVDQVTVYGTKDRPAPEPEPEPEPEPQPVAKEPAQKAAPEPKGDVVATSGVWAQLAQCESGGDPTTNTGNGYYGLYQFSQQTWAAMGGSGLPSEASAAEQTMRAQKLQAQSGWGQWPGCAAKLGLL